MNDHESMRELLPLAAAGALNAAEERELEQHLRACAQCSAEFGEWNAMAAGLRAVPTPHVPAALFERTRANMNAALTHGRAVQPWLMAVAVIAAWAATLAGWPLVREATAGTLDWLHWGWNPTWTGIALYAAAGWLTAGAAGAVLARYLRTEEWAR
jgi:anti-sigma factor RsiW